MVPRDGACSVAPSRGTTAAENIVSLESSMLNGARECSRIVSPGGVWVWKIALPGSVAGLPRADSREKRERASRKWQW